MWNGFAFHALNGATSLSYGISGEEVKLTVVTLSTAPVSLLQNTVKYIIKSKISNFNLIYGQLHGNYRLSTIIR
jgi:hypothetical protein